MIGNIGLFMAGSVLVTFSDIQNGLESEIIDKYATELNWNNNIFCFLIYVYDIGHLGFYSPIYLALDMGAIQNILTKYSLYNLTKEIAYIPLFFSLEQNEKQLPRTGLSPENHRVPFRSHLCLF